MRSEGFEAKNTIAIIDGRCAVIGVQQEGALDIAVERAGVTAYTRRVELNRG
jgi:hypothetical protein